MKGVAKRWNDDKMDEEAADAARREKTMNEKKTKGLLAAAMSTAMFVSSTAGAVPILANETAEPQAQAEATPELVPQPQSVTYAGGTLEVSDSVNVEGTDQADADAVTDLKDFLEENGIAVNETSVEAIRPSSWARQTTASPPSTAPRKRWHGWGREPGRRRLCAQGRCRQ